VPVVIVNWAREFVSTIDFEFRAQYLAFGRSAPFVKPQYTALSYTGGDPILRHAILISGQMILHITLQHLRDTITLKGCGLIKRTSLSEMTSRNFTLIHQNSGKTVVWLREEPDCD
jgi:hypothetical protein